MKDATGELSMTAVAVVAIAAISTVFMTLIWPSIKTNILRSTYCAQAFNCSAADSAGMRSCSFCESTDGNGNDAKNCSSPQTIQCPDKQN